MDGLLRLRDLLAHRCLLSALQTDELVEAGWNYDPSEERARLPLEELREKRIDIRRAFNLFRRLTKALADERNAKP